MRRHTRGGIEDREGFGELSGDSVKGWGIAESGRKAGEVLRDVDSVAVNSRKGANHGSVGDTTARKRKGCGNLIGDLYVVFFHIALSLHFATSFFKSWLLARVVTKSASGVSTMTKSSTPRQATRRWERGAMIPPATC